MRVFLYIYVNIYLYVYACVPLAFLFNTFSKFAKKIPLTLAQRVYETMWKELKITVAVAIKKKKLGIEM